MDIFSYNISYCIMKCVIQLINKILIMSITGNSL
uniref:Uncharacterized protein n=1 Tax=Heterorhabditis bacteriophora TaxID=37862 RepID=A0A1I7XBU2_HETBA